MVEDLAEGALRFIGRIILYIFLEIIFEILIKGAGFLVLKLFGKSDIDTESFSVAIVGFVFWIALGCSIWFVFNKVDTAIEVDKCLDGGGNYNYEQNKCLS